MPTTEQGGYAAHRNVIIIDGLIISGLGADDFVEWDHDTNDSEITEGGQGYVAVSTMPAERAGTIKIKVMQTSMANPKLQALLAGKPVVSIQVRNLDSGEGCFMARAVLKKSPPGSFGRVAKERTWEFAGKLRKIFGGFEL